MGRRQPVAEAQLKAQQPTSQPAVINTPTGAHTKCASASAKF